MTDTTLNSIGKPRTESPGLWVLAWRRFCRDRVGLGSFVIVVLFFVLMASSGLGLLASDWTKEVGVNYAPPAFIGAETPDHRSAATPPTAAGPSRGERTD